MGRRKIAVPDQPITDDAANSFRLICNRRDFVRLERGDAVNDLLIESDELLDWEFCRASGLSHEEFRI